MSISVRTETLPVGVVPKTPIILLALTLGAFAVGSSEFMVGGLLNQIAADLNVPVPSAGLLITGYAAGVTVGGPLVTILTGRLDRKLQIALLLAIFILGNLVCALSTSFAQLLIGRLVTAFCHGAYNGAASIAAAAVVPAQHRARALALVSAGVMIANVVGVPAGAALGQLLGWQAAFWAVTLLGAAAAIVLVTLLPRDLGSSRSSTLSELRALGRRQVVLGLLLSLCFTCGLFTTLPYLTPMLTELAHAEPSQIPGLLMMFGAGATAGVLLGGRLADWQLLPTIAIALSAQAATYALLSLFGGSLPLMWAIIFLVGLAAMLAVAPLRVVVLTGSGDAPGLASTMTSSAFNLGVAIGAAIGSTILALGMGYAALPLAGIAFALLGLVILSVLGLGMNERVPCASSMGRKHDVGKTRRVIEDRPCGVPRYRWLGPRGEQADSSPRPN